MENLVSEMKLCVKGLRELFFPRKCIVCGRMLEMDERDVCASCLAELPLTYQWSIGQNAAFERLAQRFKRQLRCSSSAARVIIGTSYMASSTGIAGNWGFGWDSC